MGLASEKGIDAGDTAAVSAELESFDTATLCEAAGGGALAPGLRPLTVHRRIAGPVLTVLCPPGDNLAIHLAVAKARAGDVIAVQTGDASFGVWGEVLTVAAMARGVRGIVIDGSARDIDSITERGFPVFARGTALTGAAKSARGEVGTPITCAGQLVRPGDFVVADVSGIVVIRRAKAHAILEKAHARRDKEAAMMDALGRGRTTLELLGLDPETAL